MCFYLIRNYDGTSYELLFELNELNHVLPIPDDHSRVILIEEHESSTDYINANYVKVIGFYNNVSGWIC